MVTERFEAGGDELDVSTHRQVRVSIPLLAAAASTGVGSTW